MRHPELWWLILAANLADFDLIPGLLLGDHNLFHRTYSHSITGALVFALLVYTTCWWIEHRRPVRMTMLMFIAYASQLFVDWLSFDPGPVVGIPLLLPFSEEHYSAEPSLFRNIERDNLFSGAVIIHNMKAVLLEILILAPPAALLWWRNKRRSLP